MYVFMHTYTYMLIDKRKHVYEGMYIYLQGSCRQGGTMPVGIDEDAEQSMTGLASLVPSKEERFAIDRGVKGDSQLKPRG